MPIEKLGSSSPVFPHFEKKENCTAAKQDGNSEAREKKMLALSYLRTGVRK